MVSNADGWGGASLSACVDLGEHTAHLGYERRLAYRRSDRTGMSHSTIRSMVFEPGLLHAPVSPEGGFSGSSLPRSSTRVMLSLFLSSIVLKAKPHYERED